MELADVKDKIDDYFDRVTPEEFYKVLINEYMKKTVFEGTVNGATYNTVQDYNEAIQRAIAAGEPINTSSSTKTVDTEDKIAEPSAGPTISMFPGFAHCKTLRDLDESFIAAGLEMPAPQFDAATERLLEGTLLPAIAKMNLADASFYKQSIEVILGFLGKTMGKRLRSAEEADAALDALVAQLRQLEENCARGKEETRVVASTANIYNRLNEAVSQRIDELTPRGHLDPVGAPGACGRCGCDPCGCPTNPADPNDYVARVHKLIDTIFGK